MPASSISASLCQLLNPPHTAQIPNRAMHCYATLPYCTLFNSELVDLGLKPLRGSGSCRSERSGEPEFEESRKSPHSRFFVAEFYPERRRAPQSEERFGCRRARCLAYLHGPSQKSTNTEKRNRQPPMRACVYKELNQRRVTQLGDPSFIVELLQTLVRVSVR